MLPINRRHFLATAAPFAVMALGSHSAIAAQTASRLTGRRSRSPSMGCASAPRSWRSAPYVSPRRRRRNIVGKIDFDAAQKIKFRPERALWSGDARAMPVRMFHLDKFNGLPVRINVVSDGMAREIVYAREDFDYGDTALAERLPVDLGFCRISRHERPRRRHRLAGLSGRKLFPHLRARRTSTAPRRAASPSIRRCNRRSFHASSSSGCEREGQRGWDHDIRAARRPEPHRRLQVRRDARTRAPSSA